MKLFKKLAAAALAAVLALSMVGCGAGGTGSAFNTKEEVLNYICEAYYTYGHGAKTANRDTTLDTPAADLITAANQAQGKDEYEKLKSAAADQKFREYVYSYEICTDLTTSAMKEQYLKHLYYDIIINTRNADEINIGAATGKIGDKTYIVVMAKVVKPSSH